MTQGACRRPPASLRLLLLGLLAGTLACVRGAAGDRPQSRIHFSDSRESTAHLQLQPRRRLRFHIAGGGIRQLDLDAVRELRFRPRRELLEQKWRFKTAGQTAKEKWGEPVPIRDLACTALLRDGATLEGHLYTTVFYLETEAGVEKLVVKAQQRGEAGTRLENLVYVTRIVLPAPAGTSPAGGAWFLAPPAGFGATDAAALLLPGLEKLRGQRGPEKRFAFATTLGQPAVIALTSPREVRVGWPPDTVPEDLTRAVEDALAAAKDFFDERTLLGVYRPDDDATLFALLRLHRRGKTSLGGGRSQPWRLGIWRLKRDPESGQMMIAARGMLARGRLKAADAPPPFVLTPQLFCTPAAGATIPCPEAGHER